MACVGHLEVTIFLVLCVAGLTSAQENLEYVENEKGKVTQFFPPLPYLKVH